MINIIKKLGPGLLFAGAAIGVSHLVQSTRAGADYGFTLIWALILANIIKYPFFLFGPKYTMATGETLLHGYKKMSKYYLVAYFILSIVTMFTIQTAVTIVTAGLAIELFGISSNITTWATIITIICVLILIIGRYKFLDNLMKFVIILLTLSTVVAVFFAGFNSNTSIEINQVFPRTEVGIIFLAAFMGWMPAPMDVSIWQSIWTLEKTKKEDSFKIKDALFDFNTGYLTTIILGLSFLSLGEFAKQLINLYTSSIGDSVFLIIAIAAFTTMFSTTITCLDASPRAMKITSELLNLNGFKSYNLWIFLLSAGTLSIFIFFISEMGSLVKIATILSFITAPFYAYINYKLINSSHTPKKFRPSKFINILSVIGLFFLACFSLWYITIL
jgi:Mn2+/Fe2+ NRAMP family transporter